MAKVMMGLRVEEETAANLDRLARLMSERAGGAEVAPATAARAALDRGVAVLLAELSERPKEKKKPARKPAAK